MRNLAAFILACGSLHAAHLLYWVQPCTAAQTGCRAGDAQLARWAMAAWQKAADGGLELSPTPDPGKAHIRFYWSGARDGLYGEARPIFVNGVRGAEVYVQTPPDSSAGRDSLLRDTIVYLTCLHESGHALGLSHTAGFADIMYNFQFGGDIAEYFGRYRRLLGSRKDIPRHSGMSSADRSQLRALFR
jgi:hypothetical protein